RIPVCSLSLHCPVDPRHLHSFPTRRSSDLVAFCQAVATITFMTVTNNRIITPSIMGFESLYTVIQTGAVYAFGVAGVVALQGTRDRKSTRLNSSHVSISYAVFCLKKKNNRK